MSQRTIADRNKTLVKLGVKIAVLCLALGVCLGVTGVLAGVARLAASQSHSQAGQAGMLLPYSVFCVIVGTVVSCLVLRSSSSGLKLASMLFVATYGISMAATFGYFVAWRNPALRPYYGGTDYPNFYRSSKSNWRAKPLLFFLQVFRAVLYVLCLYPLLRTLRVTR